MTPSEVIASSKSVTCPAIKFREARTLRHGHRAGRSAIGLLDDHGSGAPPCPRWGKPAAAVRCWTTRTLPRLTRRDPIMRNSTTHGAAPRGRHLVIAALALTGLATFSSAHADVVTDWNEIALETQFAVPLGIRTPTASRALALMHLAVFDAINSIDRRFTPYAMEGASDPAASP